MSFKTENLERPKNHRKFLKGLKLKVDIFREIKNIVDPFTLDEIMDVFFFFFLKEDEKMDVDQHII
jgi:hypothetical protein